MLRPRDFLLTIAAIYLLFASLELRSRVIRASASDVLGFNNNESNRKSEADIDLLMYKVRKSLENNRHPAQPNEPRSATNFNQALFVNNRQQPAISDINPGHQNHNSYNYYANKTTNHQQAAEPSLQRASANNAQHAEPQEVQVKFLRSLSGSEQAANGELALVQPANHTVYLLNYGPQAARDSEPQANGVRASPPSAEMRPEEQQQQPFAVFPPFNQPQPGFQQPIGGSPQAAALPQNIRNILNNYQRYPQSASLDPRLLQQLALQQQPLNPTALDNPDQSQPKSPSQARASPAGSSGEQRPQTQPQPPQQPQQPFSALQMLAAPFQAFLPGLGQPAQVNGPTSGIGQQNAGTAEGAKQQSSGAPSGQPITNSQPPFSLFNPFGIGNQPQQQPGGQQTPPLQALYQQLPLYQALLAVRQRQEALQNAQKMHQQQQQNGLVNPPPTRRPVHPPYGGQLQQPHPVGGFGGQPIQPGLGGFQSPVNNQWPPQQDQRQQLPPSAPQNTQIGPQQNQNQNPNPVQFDDDNSTNNVAGGNAGATPASNNNNNHNQDRTPSQTDNEEPQQNNDHSDNNSGSNEANNDQHENNNNNNNNGNNNNNKDNKLSISLSLKLKIFKLKT